MRSSLTLSLARSLSSLLLVGVLAACGHSASAGDAAVDAALIDASVVDSASIDASVGDASVVDAGVADAVEDSFVADSAIVDSFVADAAGPEDGAAETVRVRLMAGDLTSGNSQSYDPGQGIHIFQGLHPDVAMIQEFNYGDDSAGDLRKFVDEAFGTEFQYTHGGGQIPNGVVSRYPILRHGSWTDPEVGNRDFTWAEIDLPGSRELWAVSVHLLTQSATLRNSEAEALAQLIERDVPANDYVVIAGDFNTDSRTEACLASLASVVTVRLPFPADANDNGNTNAGRAKPYDWVLVSSPLHALETPLVIGALAFPSGLVFDSRVYTPLSDVAPVGVGDSGASQMQHMAVARDFLVPVQ